MTETSVTKYMSARADGTEEKGPAMPRPRAPWEHREMQSRQRVQRLEMRQAPPSREMARSRQAAAHCMHPVHVSFTSMRQGDSLPSKPAASPMGQNLLQYSLTPPAALILQARGARKAAASATARAYSTGSPHRDRSSGVPTAAARAAHLQSRRPLPPFTGRPFLREEAADRQSHTPK